MEKHATWIWYPGDFEVWLGNRFNNRRTERGAMFPPFWKQDSHWPTVVFTATVRLPEDEAVEIYGEGDFNVAIDGKLQTPASTRPSLSPTLSHLVVTIPAGEHRLTLKVWNQLSPPSIFIDSPDIKTGKGWETTYEDKIWIDEKGVAHGSGIYVPVASWRFDSPEDRPSAFRLPTRELHPVCRESVATDGTASSRLYDFGRETFGYLRLHGLKGTVSIYYGESREEALDTGHCETLDILHEGGTPGSKAFRYVFIVSDAGATYHDVTMLEEYAPTDPARSGTFSCSDDELNAIWQVAARTLDLTTREFFCDGIKRDRWTWSGDAIQSYLMNYYLRFDLDCVKRTIRQLRGKDPVTSHVNTIMDYTFFWFKSIADYYQYSGDADFIREMWPRMTTLMDYAVARATDGCMAEGRTGDWIFVDWADFPMRKSGVLAFEQILFWKALQTMEDLARLTGHDEEAKAYAARAKKVWDITVRCLYNSRHKAFSHALEITDEADGTRKYREDSQLTRFPNIFAIIYDFCSEETKRDILRHVLLNSDVPPITTPYMRFYELEALCRMGLQQSVLPEIKAYWGGMLRQGATTFWEKYTPGEKGAEHLAMYGRPYGKSLCHSWGAAPIYIIGKYLLGVRPVKPGYEEYVVQPTKGGLEWMEGDVPTPFGKIHVRVDPETVTVRSDGGNGKLVIGQEETPIPPGQTVTAHL